MRFAWLALVEGARCESSMLPRSLLFRSLSLNFKSSDDEKPFVDFSAVIIGEGGGMGILPWLGR